MFVQSRIGVAVDGAGPSRRLRREERRAGDAVHGAAFMTALFSPQIGRPMCRPEVDVEAPGVDGPNVSLYELSLIAKFCA